jgi:hypothetical protein
MLLGRTNVSNSLIFPESTTKYEYRNSFIYESRHVSDMESEQITVRLAIKPPREERKTPLYNDERNLIGEISLPLWVLATGPVDHNLPLRNGAGEQVARIRMAVGFEQRATVAVVFGSVECRDLVPQKRGYANPLLDISYSKYTFHDVKKTVTASKQKHNLSPAWNHLPPLRFEATYKEMITEWIDVNVQHHSKFDGYTSIGRCKLILKAILNDDALVRFDGPITRGGQETGKIKGVATFKFLPIFSQMVGGLQTEIGVFGGKQLLPEFLRPKFADAAGLSKRQGDKESDFLKLLPPTSRKGGDGSSSRRHDDETDADGNQTLDEPDVEPEPAPRARRGRAQTEMPTPKLIADASPAPSAANNNSNHSSPSDAPTKRKSKPALPSDKPSGGSPLKHAHAADNDAPAPVKKEKRGRAMTEMPPAVVLPTPKTADDHVRDLFGVFTPVLAPQPVGGAAAATAAPGTSVDNPFAHDPFLDIGQASAIVVQPSGPSQSFVSFGDNPFASSFSPSTPPPAAVHGLSAFDLASPAASRKGSEAPPVAATSAVAANPFLAALAASSPSPIVASTPSPQPTTSAAMRTASPLKPAFNPFANESPAAPQASAVEQLKQAEGKEKRRNRSQTDSLLDLAFN